MRKLLIEKPGLRSMIRSVIVVLGCLLAYFGYLYLSADRMIFVPPPPSYGEDPGIISIATTDGGKISAVFLQGPQDACTVLYSHGNAEDIGQIRPVLEEFRGHGLSVLAYDYRGYGTSGGTPSEKNAYRDVEAAYGYLVRERHTPPDRIIVCGRSLGGALAMYVADREKVGGLIVESGFVSAASVLMHVRMPLIDKFDSHGRIGRVRCPVLIIHGMKDEIVPLWHGQELYRLAPGPKLSLWIEDAGHNDLLSVAGKRYWDKIEEFVRIVRKDGGNLY